MSMNYRTDFNVIPMEVELHWNGWRTTALHLRQAGWELEMVQHMQSLSSVLVIQNPDLKMYGASRDGIDIARWEMWHTSRLNQRMGRVGINDVLTVEMRLARHISIDMPPQIMSMQSWEEETEIAPIEFGSFNGREMVKIEKLFNSAATDEIVVEKRPDVIELLQQIKDLQEPKARALLKKERQRGKVESFETTANVIALR